MACTLRAFALVQARFPEVSLTLVGSGSQDSALKALSASLGLRRVAFTGPVAPARITTHYASADLYVQTPAVDNMPLSILEAAASGLPIVSTRVGGVPALVTDRVDGLLAPANDADAVAARLIELIERPDYARQLAAAASERSAQYDWRQVRDAWLAVYRSIARQNQDASEALEAQGPA